MAEETAKEVENLKVDGEVADVVNPWEVTTSSATGVDYDKLVGEWTGLDSKNVIF